MRKREGWAICLRWRCVKPDSATVPSQCQVASLFGSVEPRAPRSQLSTLPTPSTQHRDRRHDRTHPIWDPRDPLRTRRHRKVLFLKVSDLMQVNTQIIPALDVCLLTPSMTEQDAIRSFSRHQPALLENPVVVGRHGSLQARPQAQATERRADCCSERTTCRPRPSS